MSTAFETIRKSVLAGTAFSLTVAGFAIAAAALSSGLSTSDRTSGGSTLSSASWNRLVDAVLELDGRTSPLSVTAGNVKSTGYVQGKQAAFSAYATANASGPTTAIAFWGVSANVWNHYDSTTGRFTAPVTGLYFVTARGLTNIGTDLQLRIHVNGVAVPGLTSYANAPTGGYGHQSVSGVLQLNAGDYVTVGILTSTTMHGWPNYNSGFSMFLIGS